MMATAQPPRKFEYRNCGLCAAPNAPVKCKCQATHYCDKECQRKDRKAHRKSCTFLLQKDIDTVRRELQELKESNRFANEAMPKVCQLAGLHLSVGDLLGRTMLASNYELAEEHYKQAREIERILLSGASDEEDYVGHVGNSIMTLNSLGQLYSLWQREGDALQVYQEALDCVRHTMSVYGSTPFLQLKLSETLAAQGEVYNAQYARQLRQGSGPDKQKCSAAQALGEEALAIQRALNAEADKLAHDRTAQSNSNIQTLNQAHRQEGTAHALLTVADTYVNLEMFDKARGAVQEALELTRRRMNEDCFYYCS